MQGGVKSATYMDSAYGVAVSPDGNYVFVAGSILDSVAVIDVTVKTSPVVRGGVVSATYTDNALGVAVSPDSNYVFVAGQNTDVRLFCTHPCKQRQTFLSTLSARVLFLK